jgi:hypothetical protein
MGMGVNIRQEVSDATYCDFVDGVRSVFVVQSNEYYVHKLRGKKYFLLVNEERPEKPVVRFRIESVEKGHGEAQEDIYGHYITGQHIKITLLKRQKPK